MRASSEICAPSNTKLLLFLPFVSIFMDAKLEVQRGEGRGEGEGRGGGGEN